MGWYPVSTLAAFFITLSLTVFVYWRSRDNRNLILFANMLAMASTWLFGSFFVNIAKTPQDGLLWNRLLHIGAIMVVPAFFHFVWDFSLKKKPQTFFLVPFMYAANASLLLLLFNPVFIAGVKRAPFIGYSFEPGPAYYIYVGLFAFASLFGLLAIFRTYKTSEGFQQQKAKYYLLSMILAVMSGLVFFLLSMANSPGTLPIDNLVAIAFSITFTYAALTYRLVDIKLIITKVFLVVLFSATFLTIYLFISGLFHWVLVGMLDYKMLIASTIPFVLFTSLFPPLRNGILEYIDNLVYGGHYNYRQLIKETNEALVAILDLRELLGYLTDTISENLEPQTLSFFLKDGHSFAVKSSSSLTSSNQKVAPDSPLISLLGKNKKAIATWGLEQDNPTDKKILSTLKRLKAQTAVPLLVKDSLLGFIALDVKKTGKSYSPKDLEVLNAIASTAAIALQNARLYEEAITDGLTGLYHHKYFHHRIHEELSRAKRYRYPLSVIMFDIDHFKEINDKYGHQVGDQVLEELADLTKENLRLFDIVARYGGEEFVILLPAMGEETIKRHFEKAVSIAERLRSEVQLAKFSDQKLNITISLGVAFFDGKDDEMTSKAMINASDKQLYRAKQAGRNRVCKVNLSKRLLA